MNGVVPGSCYRITQVTYAGVLVDLPTGYKLHRPNQLFSNYFVLEVKIHPNSLQAFHASLPSKKACDRVISTPDPSTNASALGFSTRTVTRSFPNSTVTMRATNVAKASTVWKEVVSTR